MASTAACVIAKGGSVCVGANALRAETFTKLCTTKTPPSIIHTGRRHDGGSWQLGPAYSLTGGRVRARVISARPGNEPVLISRPKSCGSVRDLHRHSDRARHSDILRAASGQPVARRPARRPRANRADKALISVQSAALTPAISTRSGASKQIRPPGSAVNV